MLNEIIKSQKLAHLGDQHNLGWLYNAIDYGDVADWFNAPRNK